MHKRILFWAMFTILMPASVPWAAAQANFHENVRRWDPRAPSQAQRWSSIESAILNEVNELRLDRGLNPLRAHSILSEIARRHSQDMVERSYFDHINPELHTPDERVRHRIRTLVQDVAENIWMRLGALPYESPEETARSIVADWLASPGHRQNLLGPRFTHLGIGFSGSADGLHLRATQLFAQMPAVVETAALPQP